MRYMSIHRRKPNLVDMLITRVPGALRYKVKYGANFDTAVFTTIITTPLQGYADPSINLAGIVPIHGNRIRVIFNPATYSIPDDKMFWLQLTPVDAAGADMFTTPPLLILVPNVGGTYFPQLVVTGNAPNVASLASSQEIHFPRQMRDVRIQSAAGMWVAFEAGGPEILLAADPLPKDISRYSTMSTLFVRGNGAVVPFSLLFTLAYTQ